MQMTHVVGLVLLIASVPLQMYLMKHNENFKELVAEIVQMLPKQMQGVTIDLTDYVKTAEYYLQNIYDYFGSSTAESDEPFGGENVPEHLIQNFRPPHLEFRVGDVVLTRSMIIGAIVGWKIDKSDLSKEPEYMLLIEKYKELIQETQNNMIALHSIEIKDDLINHYFESFDGMRYTPKKFLQKMYPKD